MRLTFPAQSNCSLFIEWSGSGHPLSDEITLTVWFARVAEEPDPPLTVSPHPQGYVVYVNDLAEYYEVWKSGELYEDGG